MKQVVDLCSNNKCKKVIFKDERVYNHGPDLYCGLTCALTILDVKGEEFINEST
ncbi:hypothetical protein [Amphibacillus xylanus]|uniref:Uncharacterized protein n=1 Tax=Amphibacillus xylanus (strain ATCC 51415 / DSM 6626 / JCM 7361 / LMG 17667 / NBRC 15112 / Ep01) TaxID=698758 RepID=K0IZC0_AMPXN|nr:hypothetical protein [Amphibacillus xylanus]BAM46322.1 hypothetical protein AXY_01900 [Amphibacillus xylanus NBRC 15112]